jgi:hypothetical protein
MSIKNIVTGQLASITTYSPSTGQVSGIDTSGEVIANAVSLGTGKLQLTGNIISSTADTITIDPLSDGAPTGNVIVQGNMQVAGTLTYNNIVNATTNDLQWIAANNAINPAAASGGGLSVGPSGAYASFTYNSASNVWQSSLPLLSNGGVNANGALSGATTGSFTGNVTADYFIGNGSQLTGLYANANAASYLASNANVVITTTGNITTTANIAGGNLISNQDIFATGILTLDQTFVDPAAVKMRILVDGDTSFIQVGNGTAASTGNLAFAPWFDGTGRVVINTGTGNINAGNIATVGQVVATGNVSGNYFIGNGAFLTGILTGYEDYLQAGRFTTTQPGVGVDTDLVFNSVTAQSGTSQISLNTTTGVLSLKGGVTYNLTASPSFQIFSNTTTGFLVYQWVDATTNTPLIDGISGAATPATLTNADSNQQLVSLVYTPSTNQTVKVRVTSASGTASLRTNFTYITVTQIGVSAGTTSFTNLTVTGNTTSGNVITTGNITVGTGAFFIGDGGLLSNISGGGGSYSNANVESYLPTYTGNLDSLTGNVTTTANISATGNISAGNLTVGNIGITGNITMSGGKISGSSGTTPAKLQHYGETVVAGGNLTGTLAINTTLGTIQRYTLTGSITINGFVNAVAGTNATLILKQDATGGRTLTSTMKFLGGVKTLSTAANAIDVLSVFYDGTDYLATLGKGYA